MVKNMKKILLSSIFLLLSSCNLSVDYSDYIGYWQLNDSEKTEVAKIFRDGEIYLLDKNILSEGLLLKRSLKPTVFIIKDNKLTTSNAKGADQLELSDNKETLYFGDKTYSKIDKYALQKVVNERNNQLSQDSQL